MTDIFMSYAREDQSVAEQLAATLTKRGWSVFWDRTIPTGKKWDDVLHRQLRRARCVIVLWSRNSVQSEWVLHEASIARHRGKLIPAQLEPVLDEKSRVAVVFGSIQTVPLFGTRSGELMQDKELIRAVERLIGSPKRWLPWSLGALLVALIVWKGGEGVHGVHQLAQDVSRGFGNEDVMRRAGVKWISWGPYGTEENARDFALVRDAHTIDMVVTNANFFTSNFRTELKTFFSRPDSHMRIAFASPDSPFYAEMGKMRGFFWESSAARQGDSMRSEQAKQDLLADTTDQSQVEFKYYDTQYRMPVILIDRHYCILTARLPPDEGQESLRIESDESGVPTLASTSNPKSKPRVLPNVTASCKAHFDALWAQSSTKPFGAH